MTSRFAFRLSLVLACSAALAGCGTVKNLFHGKGEKEAAPATLMQFTPGASVSQLWSADVGKGETRVGAHQRPAIADGKVFAAAVDGGVHALDLQTGHVIWTYAGKDKKHAVRFSGGPGVGDGLVVAGGLDGEVVALDQATGAERWTGKVNNEVISAPAIGNGLVVVHSNDGKVTAFDEATGEKRWSWSDTPVSLTVRGSSAPLMGPGYVFIGTDSGKLVALSAADGNQAWEATVADPDGRNELERMNDVDGTPVLDGSTLYASSYKGHTIAVDGPSGQVLWMQEHGGVGGTGLGASNVVITDAKDAVWGIDRSTGAPMWQQNGFARRNVSAPAVQGNYAVVGDYQGYLQWLQLQDGKLVARMRMGSKPIVSQPVVADGVLVAQDASGRIAAFRLAQ